MPMPSTKNPIAARAIRSVTTPVMATDSPTATSIAPSRVTAVAPNRSIRRPLSGSAITEPTEIASSRRPSEPLSSSSPLRMSGSRETIVAKQNPLRAKLSATALRVARRDDTSVANRIGGASPSRPPVGAKRRAAVSS